MIFVVKLLHLFVYNSENSHTYGSRNIIDIFFSFVNLIFIMIGTFVFPLILQSNNYIFKINLLYLPIKIKLE